MGTTTMHIKYWLSSSIEVILEVDGVGQFKQTGTVLGFSLTGLNSNTNYIYRLKNNNGDIIDQGGIFKTFKDSGDVSFCFIADFSGYSGFAKQNAEQMLKSGCEFYVTGGDQVYHADYETNLNTTEVFSRWVNSPGFKELHRNLPVFPVCGNHDRSQVLAQVFEGGCNRTAIKNGDVLIVTAFSYGASTGSGASGIEYKNWIDSTIVANKRLFNFFISHYAGYHCDAGYIYDQNIRNNWYPVLDTHQIDYVLHGHHHTYVRFNPINNIKFLINGGGSSAGSTGNSCFGAVPAVKRSGAGSFSKFSVANKILTLTTYKHDGSVWDTDVIDKSNSIPPPPPPEEIFNIDYDNNNTILLDDKKSVPKKVCVTLTYVDDTTDTACENVVQQ